MIRQRASGTTLQAIADGLIADDIATALGGRWQPGTVRHVLNSQRAADLRASSLTAQ
ncbi:recombinase family protein [Rhodococcoides fascians]|uniref:recombinase family protein n=1 Tax=Rhodococcoides fascians TaxID=1828 RepID=UPI0012FDFA9D